MKNFLKMAMYCIFCKNAAKRKGMALIKLGGGVADIRGSIGGTVFSRGRYGAIARNRTIPVDPASSKQVKIRSIASVVRNAWFSTLTAAQRAAWDTYAAGVQMTNRLGETINLTGWNHFCRSNMSVLYNDLTLIANGPTTLALPEKDESIAVSASAATQLLSISFDEDSAWVDEDDAYLLVYASKGQNPTKNFFKGPFELAGKIAGDATTAPTSPQTITAPSTLTSGQRVFVQCRILRADGRLSEPFRAYGSVGA